MKLCPHGIDVGWGIETCATCVQFGPLAHCDACNPANPCWIPACDEVTDSRQCFNKESHVRHDHLTNDQVHKFRRFC